MRDDGGFDRDGDGVPDAARLLGYAGLLPQAAAVLAIAFGGNDYRYAALALAFAYASSILSFLGGIWWGLAARSGRTSPEWSWYAAVAPSLIAVAAGVPWVVGWPWPEPSLLVLGAIIAASPIVDAKLERIGLAPKGWTRFRIKLSAGLGLLTMLAALL